MAEQQGRGLQASGTAGGAQWMGTGARAAGAELSGGPERQAVYKGKGDHGVPTWPGDNL